MTDLGVISSCCSYGFDINNFDDVCGQSTEGMSWKHYAALWRAGQRPISLGALFDDDSKALGMNDIGQVVGLTDYSESEVRGFIWQDGVMTSLGTLGGNYSIAWDINNNGQAVGSSDNLDGWEQAFVWQSGVMTPLSSMNPSDPDCAALDITMDGVVAGISSHPSGVDQTVKWVNGIPMTVGSRSNMTSSSPSAINEFGEMSGIINLDHEGHACIWTATGDLVVLEEHLPPKHKWTEILYAWDINDLGMICGTGQYPPYTGSFDDRGWVAVPVTPGSSLAQPVPGLAGRRNRLTASGVTPGKKVYFVYGLQGGGSVIPGCDLAETLAAIQIEQAKVIGSATANGQGVASLDVNVPDAARNAGEVLIQAVVPTDCVISNLVVEVFE